MNPILEIVVKLLASSALMVLFYFALFRGKASYRASRLFLLAIPLVSIVISFVSIEGHGQLFSFASLFGEKAPATTVPAVASTVPNPVPVEVFSAPVEEIVPEPVIPAPADVREGEAIPVMVEAARPDMIVAAPPPPVKRVPERGTVVAVLYAVVMLLLAGLILRQMVALWRIRRKAERRVIAGCTIYFSREVRSAFSVMRNIYVSAEAPKEKLAIVIRHEKEHIVHRHYIDLAVMEFFTLLVWFNPFVWIVRRELRSVHEFEADHGTLAGGVQMRDYMLAILEETAGVIPVMANGLKSSMIKKRFLEMKTANKIRFKALRWTLTVPFAALLMLFFAFKPTVAAQQEPDATLNESEPVADSAVVLLSKAEVHDLRLDEGEQAGKADLVLRQAPPAPVFVRPETQNPKSDTTRIIVRGRDAYFGRDITIANMRTTLDSIRNSVRTATADSIRRSPRVSVRINGIGYLNDSDAKKIDQYDRSIDSLNTALLFQKQLLYNEISAIREKYTADISTPGIMLGERQPAAPEPEPALLTAGDFPVGFDFAHYGITVGEDWLLLNPDGHPIRNSRDFEGYNAKYVTNKRVIVNSDPSRRTNGALSRILRIERGNNETKVTLASNIYWDWNWLFFDKETCLIDPKTGDRYMIRDIVGDEEVGRMSWIWGLKGKTIERTIIFPPLPKELKVVDIFEPDNFTDLPTKDNGGGFYLKGVRIDDFAPKPAGKIIR